MLGALRAFLGRLPAAVDRLAQRPWGGRVPRRVVSWLERVATSGWSRLAVFCALGLAGTFFQVWRAGDFTDFRDYQYLTLFEEAARRTVAKYHELPLWNPYYCGGVYGLGTPSAHFVSPMFLVTLVFRSVTRADPVIAFAMTVVGLEGTFRFAMAHGARPLGAMLAAPAFALSGLFAALAPLGGMNFYSFELVPWAAYGLHVAFAGRVRGAVVAALALGWMVGHGGTYPAPMMMLVGLLELAPVVYRAIRTRQGAALLRALEMGALAALLATAMGMVRLWPIADVLGAGKRLIGTTESHALLDIGRMLFNGSFMVGAVALPLVLVGAARRRTVPLTLAVVLLVWLAMGFAVKPSLFGLLRKVPPYTMLRAPERFLTIFALYYAALAALGMRTLRAVARAGRWAGWPMLLACGLMVGNLGPLLTNQTLRGLERARMEPPATTEASEFHQARGDRWLASFYPPLERGSLSCFDDYDVPQAAALRGDLAQEENLVDPNAGSLRQVSWSPNRISLHAELTRPARVLVNQNWHPGWRSSAGTVVEDDGRLALDLPAGTSDPTLHFLPRSAVGGAAATLLALAVAVLLWRRARGGPPAFLLVGVPFLPVVLAFALMDEPRRHPPRLVTPAGDPIVVDAPPVSATAYGVRFQGGVTLEAVRFAKTGSRAEPSLAIELDWRKTTQTEPGLGVFLHLEPESGDGLNVDHVRISTAAAFDDLPVGPVLRDVLPPIDLEAPKTPKTFTVYVGLWRARGDGTRLHALDKPPTVDDDRVRIGVVSLP